MRAAYIEQLGPPEIIRYGELPTPQPGPNDVLVDVTVATVNHVDTFVRSGAWRTPVEFPFVIGRDLVGTVAAAGPGAPGFAVGDRVWCNSLGHGGRQGAAADQAVVPVDRLYHLPDGVDPGDAVAMAHPAATAYLALFTHGRMRPGETVVVLGAAGNVGAAVVVMAAEAGARVIAVASARDAEYCRSLGAAEVIDYRDPDVPKRVLQASAHGVDLHVDTAAHNDLDTAVGLLAKRGRIVLLAGMRTRPVLPVGPLYLKDCSAVGFAISQATTAELAEAAVAINRLLANGRLRPRRTRTLPLSEAAEAHRAVEAGEAHGIRLILRTGTAPAGSSSAE
ncbi:NADPH:quinone reductase [Streptantibioticus ferralitis]|uniref:NADPH:quinone reductase n=1 Tax=Streptantibioticus ferralitis TaxID=236510 RepID=A0ABT5ZA36_9ACTN|nr:NADPH:quinone reductase [Streptantibioticus ferralitis]MDF2260708.1 NADPH:quinone reductase [Streptantibioticus ferralitis]